MSLHESSTSCGSGPTEHQTHLSQWWTHLSLEHIQKPSDQQLQSAPPSWVLCSALVYPQGWAEDAPLTTLQHYSDHSLQLKKEKSKTTQHGSSFPLNLSSPCHQEASRMSLTCPFSKLENKELGTSMSFMLGKPNLTSNPFMHENPVLQSFLLQQAVSSSLGYCCSYIAHSVCSAHFPPLPQQIQIVLFPLPTDPKLENSAKLYPAANFCWNANMT